MEKLSVVIITKNEEAKIANCLKSLTWVDEIVVVDTGSTDNTVEIAKKFTNRVYKIKKGGFSYWRNYGIKKTTGDWILYVDTDEEVSVELREEIKAAIDNPVASGYALPRRNIILAKELKHGGWWPDYVKRLFKKTALKKWQGELHEEPVIDGTLALLKKPLIHHKHDRLEEMVEKTNSWSKIEAKLLFDNNHPRMVWWRFFRIMFGEFWFRMIINKAFLDGPEGVIYALYQVYSRFITYAKLWEMQKTMDRKGEKSIKTMRFFKSG